MRYRKKPVEVEAWQVGSDEPMPEWIVSAEPRTVVGGLWTISLRGGNFLIAHYGDYVVKEGSRARKYESQYFRWEYEPFRPYYEEVYDWAFSGLEGCDGEEYEMFCKITDAIAEYRHQLHDSEIEWE